MMRLCDQGHREVCYDELDDRGSITSCPVCDKMADMIDLKVTIDELNVEIRQLEDA